MFMVSFNKKAAKAKAWREKYYASLRIQVLILKFLARIRYRRLVYQMSRRIQAGWRMHVARIAYLSRFSHLVGTDALGILQRWCSKAAFKVSRTRCLRAVCAEGTVKCTITTSTITTKCRFSSTIPPHPTHFTSIQPHAHPQDPAA